jgi:hypothetical protein
VSGNTLGSLSLKNADSAKLLPGRAAGQCVAIGDADLSEGVAPAGTGLPSNTAVQQTTKLATVDKRFRHSAAPGVPDIPMVWCLCSGVSCCVLVFRCALFGVLVEVELFVMPGVS